MSILITGGAGYIGSHVVKALGLQGEKLIIVDNLSTGHKEAVLFGELVLGDIGDEKFMNELFTKYKFESVIHFAGSIVVPESVSNPLKYYRNNTLNSELLLELCVKYQTKHFIFSSTAAVYGMPESGVCSEESDLKPINPYGSSKLMIEEILWDVSRAKNLKGVALRYFNVAGADPEGQLGQSFPEATHLIKVAAEVVTGKRSELKIFGTDYPTPDGTCVRDYIHVSDLADAHVKALHYLRAGGETVAVNCGYGRGFSVSEVVDRVKKVSGIDFKVQKVERRPGDPAALTAKADKIQKLFGWKPKYNDLDFIVKTALEWEKTKPF
ncbi:MAG: UDP-glucose 4-epimerase GalE [Bacteriovoracaceae bacterium]|nr:UDP-glucose 4-epimerase GalE [Bacteriovoracaceae bacterium]